MEVRNRLVLGDSDLIGVGVHPPRFVPDAGHRWSALDLACDSCEAPAGASCEGSIICSSRITKAREAIAAGELEPKGPARKHEPCTACGKKKLHGRPLACSEGHRCAKEINGSRCKIAVVPGGRLCSHHAALWVGVKKPGRKPGTPNAGRPSKVTPEQRIEIIKRHAAGGITLAALGEEFGVHPSTIKKVLKSG